MASMDWFRWHHGSVTDPKFALVARKAGASVPDVLAVWAYILETASQSVERGDFGTVDVEALDCVFGFPATETRTANILEAMAGRDLTEGTRIAAWEKRQPKREREDITNADRQAAFKAKQNQVTPDNANPDQKKPREEKSRGDKSNSEEGSANAPAIPESLLADFLELRKAKKAGKLTATALAGIQREADKAGVSLNQAITACCEYSWVGFNAGWYADRTKTHGVNTIPNKQEALEASNAAVVARFLEGQADVTH
jgi:hypothetical protein